MTTATARTLTRGEHLLPHQSQRLGRDLTAEKIARHYGATALGYRRTPEQVQDCRDGKPGTGLPYEYLVYDPRSAALAWTAFFTEADLLAWGNAYNIGFTLPEPGQTFRLRLPDDDRHMAPLTEAGGS